MLNGISPVISLYEISLQLNVSCKFFIIKKTFQFLKQANEEFNIQNLKASAIANAIGNVAGDIISSNITEF